MVISYDNFSKIPAEAKFSIINVEVLMTLKQKDTEKFLFPTHPTSFKTWQKLFSKSVSVHFFSHTSASLQVVDDPRYSAYALLGKLICSTQILSLFHLKFIFLGPQYCPLAYYSTNNF